MPFGPKNSGFNFFAKCFSRVCKEVEFLWIYINGLLSINNKLIDNHPKWRCFCQVGAETNKLVTKTFLKTMYTS